MRLNRIITCLLPFLLSTSWLFAQLSPTNTLLLLKAYNTSGQLHKASEIVSQNQDLLTNEFIVEKGITYYLSGDYKEAANYFYEANQNNSELAAFELARCYSLMNKPELACQMLEQHLKSKNKKMQHQIKKDTAFLAIEKSVFWIDLWRNDWYSKYELMFEDAYYEYKNNNLEEALKIINELIEIRKTMYEAYSLKAEIYQALGEFDNGLIVIEDAVKKRPKNAQFHYIKSTLEIDLQKYKKAIKSIEQAKNLDSTTIEFYFTEIQALTKLNKTDKSIKAIEQLLELYPEAKVYALASTVYSQSREYSMAIKAINKCISMEKYNPTYYMARADLYMETKLYSFAEKDYTMTLDFFPTNGELFFKRGLARLNQAKYNESCSDFNKAYQCQYMPANDYLMKYCRNYIGN